MRYLKEEQFATAVGQPFRMKGVKNDLNAETDAATVSEVLHWLLTCYGNAPHMTGVLLTLPESRGYGEAMRVLEGEPDEHGCYAFEDAHFEAMTKAVHAVLPIYAVRNSGIIQDLLKDAPRQVHLREIKAAEA